MAGRLFTLISAFQAPKATDVLAGTEQLPILHWSCPPPFLGSIPLMPSKNIRQKCLKHILNKNSEFFLPWTAIRDLYTHSRNMVGVKSLKVPVSTLNKPGEHAQSDIEELIFPNEGTATEGREVFLDANTGMNVRIGVSPREPIGFVVEIPRTVQLEVERLIDAIADVVCLRTYFPCYEGYDNFAQVALGMEPGAMNHFEVVSHQLTERCAAISTILVRASLIPEGLFCAGYFYDSQVFYERLTLYEMRMLPRAVTFFHNADYRHGNFKSNSTNPDIDFLLRARAKHNKLKWSNVAIDLGAAICFDGVDKCMSNLRDLGESTCDITASDCLCTLHDFECILFEGDHQQSSIMEARYRSVLGADQKRIITVPSYVTPNDVSDAIANVVTKDFAREKPSQESHDFFPDYLKIDVDNGDCEFLEALLHGTSTKSLGDGSNGEGIFFRPAMIVIEAMQFRIPPFIAYSGYFNRSLASTEHSTWESQSSDEVNAWNFRGCSLGEVLRVTEPYNYTVLRLDVDNTVTLIAQQLFDLSFDNHQACINTRDGLPSDQTGKLATEDESDRYTRVSASCAQGSTLFVQWLKLHFLPTLGPLSGQLRQMFLKYLCVLHNNQECDTQVAIDIRHSNHQSCIGQAHLATTVFAANVPSLDLLLEVVHQGDKLSDEALKYGEFLQQRTLLQIQEHKEWMSDVLGLGSGAAGIPAVHDFYRLEVYKSPSYFFRYALPIAAPH